MNNKELVKKALEMAKIAHSGQVDRAGKNYLTGHVLAVFNGVGGVNANPIELAIVAILHDSVEDSGGKITVSDIQKEFGNEVAKAVDVLTKRASIPYDSYISKIKSNSLARKVKIVDIIHNSDISRIPNPGKLDYERLEKYKHSLSILR